MAKQDYFIGLDIGTNSVGWAVTDENYNVLRGKGSYMWGTRLFDEGKTAETRRIKRAGRRRLMRRKQRLSILAAFFSPIIEPIDSTFFIRLKESQLHKDDKSTNYKHEL